MPSRQQLAKARAAAAGATAKAGSGLLRAPAGVHPETWRLRCALITARDRVPFATAEARLLDGLCWFVKAAAKGATCDPAADGRRLAPGGPGWAGAVAAVGAVARVCSAETQVLLAPWCGPAGAASGAAGVDFRPFGG